MADNGNRKRKHTTILDLFNDDSEVPKNTSCENDDSNNYNLNSKDLPIIAIVCISVQFLLFFAVLGLISSDHRNVCVSAVFFLLLLF